MHVLKRIKGLLFYFDVFSFIRFSLYMVFSSELQQLINPDLVNDPTLPRSFKDKCPKCGKLDAVYFVALRNQMNLTFLCRTENCGFSWISKKPDKKPENSEKSDTG